jgi:hypothetical protein
LPVWEEGGGGGGKPEGRDGAGGGPLWDDDRGGGVDGKPCEEGRDGGAGGGVDEYPWDEGRDGAGFDATWDDGRDDGGFGAGGLEEGNGGGVDTRVGAIVAPSADRNIRRRGLYSFVRALSNPSASITANRYDRARAKPAGNSFSEMRSASTSESLSVKRRASVGAASVSAITARPLDAGPPAAHRLVAAHRDRRHIGLAVDDGADGCRVRAEKDLRGEHEIGLDAARPEVIGDQQITSDREPIDPRGAEPFQLGDREIELVGGAADEARAIRRAAVPDDFINSPRRAHTAAGAQTMWTSPAAARRSSSPYVGATSTVT